MLELHLNSPNRAQDERNFARHRIRQNQISPLPRTRNRHSGAEFFRHVCTLGECARADHRPLSRLSFQPAAHPFFLQNCRKDCKINKSNIIFPVLADCSQQAISHCGIHPYSYTTAANATLLGNTAPLWVAIGAWLLFRERLSTRFWLGLGLALAGAASDPGDRFSATPAPGHWRPDGNRNGSLLRRVHAGHAAQPPTLQPADPSVADGQSAPVSACCSINLVLGNPITGYSAQTWLVFFAAAIVSQIVGYMSLTYALGHLPASIVSPTMIGQPIVTAILAVPLLGEIPTFLQFVGGVTALAGIYIVNQAHNRSKQIPKSS